MKKTLALVIALVLFAVVGICSVSATAPATTEGEVIYSLDLSGGSLDSAGIKIGTASAAEGFNAKIENGELKISDAGGKGFLIFDNCTALTQYSSYVIEYTFSFESALSDTGYLCYMFRGEGNEPTNTEDFNFRFNGTNNKFEPENNASMKANIAAGKKVTVKIPIIDRYVENATVTVENESNTMTRTQLVLLDEGGKPGLICKNVNATLYSLTIKELKAAETTTEEPTVTTTEEPTVTTTEEPVVTTTEDPIVTTTEKPAEPTVTTTVAPADEGGCGGIGGLFAALIALLPLSAFVIFKSAKHR